MKKYLKLIVILILSLITLYFSRNFMNRQWQEFKLNKEFICPENQTPEQVEVFTNNYANFYLNNYPNMTFDYFLGNRMQLLISKKCAVSLQNLVDNTDFDTIPDENVVRGLKEIPYGPNNPTLKEVSEHR